MRCCRRRRGPHCASTHCLPDRPQIDPAFTTISGPVAAPLVYALPAAPRICACRGRLDALRCHKAACANAGTLPAKSSPNGLPLWPGTRRAIDATNVSPSHSHWRGMTRALPLGGRWHRNRGPVCEKDRHVAASVWRVTALLAVAAQRTFAASPLELLLARECSVGRDGGNSVFASRQRPHLGPPWATSCVYRRLE